MANYQATARSNYVKIKDMEGLKKALKPFDIAIWEQDGMVGFGQSEMSDGGWPGWCLISVADDEPEEEIEFDPAIQICPFMEEGQVLVMMESGHEKLRYVQGHAQAFNTKGGYVQLILRDIYQMAADKFGVPLATITHAEY